MSDLHLNEQLAQSARQIGEARMLRDDESITDEKSAQIIGLFNSYLERTGKSLKWASQALGAGFSPGVLSELRTGSYKGDTEGKLRALDRALEQWHLKERAPKPAGFVKIGVARQIYGVAKYCVSTNTIGLIHGPAGIGKTITVNAVDRRAVQVFAQDTMADLAKATASMGENSKRILRSIAAEKLSNQDLNRILAGGVIEGRPRDTIRELKKELDRVYDGGMITITTASGGTMTFEPGYYAEMVARTRTREAVVTARHNRFRDLGEDLVSIIGRVSDNFCTAFLGEVFSLSGTHPKYPAYSSLPGGGPPFHPNCSKSTRLYIEALASDAQKEVAEGVEGAEKLRGMSPTQAQRAYKDLQLRKEVEQSYKRVTPIKGPKRMTVDGPADPGDFITDRQALAELSQFGVASVKLATREELGEIVIPQLKKAIEKVGVAPSSIVVDAGPFRAAKKNSPLNYNRDTDRLSINPDWPHWDRVAERTLENHRDGLWSSDKPLHMYYHDLALAKLARSTTREQYMAIRAGRFRDTALMERIASKVSSNATLSHGEFIAEVFAARTAGMEIPKDITALYHSLGGP